MTYANFKTTVLSYVNRSSAVFTAGTLDYVLTAMNDARRDAQRRYTFNLLRTQAFGQLSLAPCNLLTDFDTTPVSGTLIVVKQIDGVYTYDSATVGATLRYYRQNKVPFHRQSQFDMELDVDPTAFGGSQNVITGQLSTARQFVYQQGNNLFHSTLSTPAWYLCDVVQWLPDHDGGAGEDVFLTYCSDWLKWATLVNMNVYLKDDQQVSISASLLERSWNSVMQFDSQQGASTGAINLD